MTWKEDWNEFKKELTWNNAKAIISAGIPMGIGGWILTQWINFLVPIMNKYLSTIHATATPEQGVMALCLIMGLVFPLYPLLMWTCMGGLWLGRVTRFYNDDRTRTVYLDNCSYFIRDIPEDKRTMIKELLAPYKSKYQLRKERKAKESWLRRNFT